MSKRKCYSIKEKLDVLERIQNGETKAKISKETGIPESTLRGWVKEEEANLRNYVETIVGGESFTPMEESTSTPNNNELDRDVFSWFIQTQRSGKRMSYSIKEKLTVIERIRNGETKAKISKMTGIPESTLRGWMKEEANLKKYVGTVVEDGGLAKMKVRNAADQKLDKAVLTWFLQEQSRGTPLSGPIIRNQAEKIHRRLHPKKSFVASKGWLYRFQKRHGIGAFCLNRQQGFSRNQSTDEFPVIMNECIKAESQTPEQPEEADQPSFVASRRWLDDFQKHQAIETITNNEEQQSVDKQSTNEFPVFLNEYMKAESLTPEQIYNAVESGFYWKMLPEDSLAITTEAHLTQGNKQAKNRLTLLFACNGTGTHKLKLLAVGKYRSPRCLHHVNLDNLPVIYRHSNGSWLTASLFEEWFFNSFVPNVRNHLRRLNLPEKATLLLDDCSIHPRGDILQTKDGQIKALYLPKNSASKFQPCNAGITRAFKQIYKKELIMDVIESSRSVNDYLKQFSIKNAMHISARIWAAVSKTFIANCWNKTLGTDFLHPQSTMKEEEEVRGFNELELTTVEQLLGNHLNAIVTVQDWIYNWEAAEEAITATEMLPDTPVRHEPEDDPEDLESQPPKPAKTLLEAVSHIEWLIEFTDCEDYDPIYTMHLKHLLRQTQIKRKKRMTPKKLSDFFRCNFK